MATAGWITLLIAIWLASAVGAAWLARIKGRSFWGFLALGLLVNGIFALIVVLLLPDRRSPGRAQDKFAQLKTLEELRDAGSITPETFASESERVLAGQESTLAVADEGVSLRDQPLRYLPGLIFGVGLLAAGLWRLTEGHRFGAVFIVAGGLVTFSFIKGLATGRRLAPEPKWQSALWL